KGIGRVVLGHESSSSVKKAIQSLYPSVEHEEDDLLGKVKGLLLKYFDGEVVCMDVPLEFPSGTLFQRKVWESVRSIPYGDIKTYGWLAEKLLNPGASRAVGNALSKNPIPLIIPCHRVVRSDGKMGGFSLSGGTMLKKKLIDLEKKNKRFKACN
ncbi:MAG: methylated-DNA--[protein]-cysteine S-methyltransferase, partial [Oligoflexia bacterium]|nr:methylated-DNA--[protein]-cysteine S-methyltransferase [Oligoflexia bacterium]